MALNHDQSIPMFYMIRTFTDHCQTLSTFHTMHVHRCDGEEHNEYLYYKASTTVPKQSKD